MERTAARTRELGSHGASGEAEAFAVVAGRVFHILNFEDTLGPVLAGKGEVVAEVGAETVLAAAVLRVDPGLAPGVGLVVGVHIEVYLAEHGLRGALGGAAEVFVAVLRLVPQALLGVEEVLNDMLVDGLCRGGAGATACSNQSHGR